MKLTAAQDENWPAVETALRYPAKARAARMAEWREKAKGRYEHSDLIETLPEGAKAMTARAGEMEKIADSGRQSYGGLLEALADLVCATR